MTGFPPRSLALAGFVLAHAAWSVSDTADDELLCPLAMIDRATGRDVRRFEAATQEDAIRAGQVAMAQASADAEAWAFAREGAWRPTALATPHDVLVVDFWARGMTAPATLLQPFERATKRGRFRIVGAATLVWAGQLVEAVETRAALEAIGAGIATHPKVAELWAAWQ